MSRWFNSRRRSHGTSSAGFGVLRRGRRSGGSLVEMIFVLPILLGLAFGVVEYGYFIFVKHTVQAAAREGARAGIVASATNQNVTDAVASVMSAAGLSYTGYSVGVTDPAGSPVSVGNVAAGDGLKVTVQCTWGSVGIHPLPEILGGMSSSKIVKGSTVMRKEG
jgi:Flp pilus assembly protein TadG